MKNMNKPQWLIDAENEIKSFEESKFGKMSNQEFKLSERQSNAGKSGGVISQQNITFEQRSLKSKKVNITLGAEGKIKRAKKANDVLTPEQRTFRNKKGQETCRQNLFSLYLDILNMLPNEFSKQQYVNVLKSFDKEPSFIYYCNKTFPGHVELKRKGSPKSNNLEYYYIKIQQS